MGSASANKTLAWPALRVALAWICRVRPLLLSCGLHKAMVGLLNVALREVYSFCNSTQTTSDSVVIIRPQKIRKPTDTRTKEFTGKLSEDADLCGWTLLRTATEAESVMREQGDSDDSILDEPACIGHIRAKVLTV